MKVFKDRHIRHDYLQFLLLLMFITPVFFLITGEIFAASDFNYDSQGSLKRLPLPVAIVICFVGIAVLFEVKRLKVEVAFIFMFFVMMMISIAFTSEDKISADRSKFVLMVQFLLPTFALLLGALYNAPKSEFMRLEAILAYMLLAIVPSEIFVTMHRGEVFLSPYLFHFSLYQHIHYLPVIFVAFYLIVVLANFQQRTLVWATTFLAPFMGIYICASFSTEALLLGIIGGVVAFWLLCRNARRRYGAIILLSASLGFLSYMSLWVPEEASRWGGEVSEVNAINQSSSDLQLQTEGYHQHSFPLELNERFSYWVYYLDSIMLTPEIMIFGHQERPDRARYPSAHNYYLDLVYHFGLIVLLPIIFLMVTFARLIKSLFSGRKLSTTGSMLVFLIGYFLLVDANLNVSLRQPYPGMMMFFLWGILISMLEGSRAS